MDGIHDMGGMDGFGKVDPEPNEPVFHESWEGRVLAMSRVMGASGAWNIDMGRYGIELLPPHVYLASSYYKKWFLRLEQMLTQRGSHRNRRSSGRPRVASRQDLGPRYVHRGRCRVYSAARLVRAASTGSGAIQAGRSRACEKHSSQDTHPSAALCARTRRRD